MKEHDKELLKIKQILDSIENDESMKDVYKEWDKVWRGVAKSYMSIKKFPWPYPKKEIDNEPGD